MSWRRQSRRRPLLLSAMTLVAGACAPAHHVAVPAPVTPPADFEGWQQEARGMLSDSLDALRTFDVFQAFRVTTAASSSMKLGAELAWDPPISTDWDEATHVTRGLRGRAEQLFQAVTTARLDSSLWREQRAIADATHDLLDLGDALAAYRERVDVLSPGDASNALSLLEDAWTHWDAVAARWGMSRGEAIACGT